MTNTCIILGYGVFIKPNHDYQKYLESSLEDALNHKPDKIITCAGCSKPKYPTLSEAVSMKNLFLESHPELSTIIVTEEQSLSTPQSLEFSQKFVEPGNVFIYCDSIRVPKVLYLAISLYFKNLTEKEKIETIGKIYISQNPDVSKKVVLTYQHITVVGTPLSNTIELASQQIVSSMLEMHAFDYPDLHQQFIDWRKKQWGVK